MDPHLSAVQRALDLIEERLTAPLSAGELARRAGMSPWHFLRIFAGLVGEPPGSYLRRRRLTAAVEALRDSRRRVLDVALDHQFESHESFTRAFKGVFGLTPSDFRRHRQLPWARTRPRLDPAHLPFLAQPAAMNPTIVTVPAGTLLGLETRFISAMSPDANNLQVIPPLFDRFFARRGELPPALDGFTYGACNCLPADQRTRDDELVYLVGIRVAADAPVPAGMTTWTLPERRYAHFVHRGPVTRLSETINHAHGAWLLRSPYELADGPELERYDERFGHGGEGSEMDFLIPIQPRPR